MSSDNKGLASAEKEQSKELQKQAERQRARDKEGLSEAGRKGGESQSLKIEIVCQRLAKRRTKLRSDAGNRTKYCKPL